MSTQDTLSKASVTPTLAVVAVVALLIAGLATLDKFLASAQELELQRLAQRSYLDGLHLRSTGETNEAVDAFRKAHAFERRNTDYELQLVDALIAAGKTSQAELLIRDVLEREPNNGRANLLGAHLMIANGRTAEAESYYHRAIYGEWPGGAAAQRVAVRTELADFLAAHGAHEELLAELLPLQEEAGKDLPTHLHLAQLFLVSGSASRAADEYRAVIKRDRKNGTAYEGLGEAELQLGDYRLAHEAFLTASVYQREDASIGRQLELASTLAALDPTSRKLTSFEKYSRSLKILALARSSLETCEASHPAPDSGGSQQTPLSEEEAFKPEPGTGVTNEIAEKILALAEKDWQTRIKICGAPTSADEEPLRLIMEKLAQ